MITEEIRSYEVSIWTLQDEFITVLKWSDAEQKGRIENPQMTLNIDGTQEFTFSIPMYYNYHGKLIDNPNWYNVENGNIIEGLRKIKIIFDKEKLIKMSPVAFAREAPSHVFEFLITNVEESHEKDVASCNVKCEGAAFHELGKIGYKISLSQENFELTYEYWAKHGYWFNNGGIVYINRHKVVNEKPVSGENGILYIVKDDTATDYTGWLYIDDEWVEHCTVSTTMPIQSIDYWCNYYDTCDIPLLPNDTSKINPRAWYYTVRMNQMSYKDGTLRSQNKVYEEPYPTSFKADATPDQYEYYQEKARPVEVDKSNLYNITQTIAETFHVHCKYEYGYDQNFHIISRTIVFYNHFFQEDKGYMSFTYPYSSSKIVRNKESTNVATKLYVLTADNENTVAGYNTIMNAQSNPTHEDYILNFDYLNERGIIADYQYEAIKPYEQQMREINEALSQLQQNLSTYNQQKIDIEAKLQIYKESIDIDKENIGHNEALRNELDIQDKEADGYITVSNTKPDTCIIREDSSTGDYFINLSTTNKGIVADTIRIYRTYSAGSFTLGDEVTTYSIAYDEYGRPSRIYGVEPAIPEASDFISSTVYLTYKYDPELYYDSVVATWEVKLANDEEGYRNTLVELGPESEDDEYFDLDAAYPDGQTTLATAYENGLNKKITDTSNSIDDLIYQKRVAIKEFEQLMGPALREGYWPPENYQDYGNHLTDTQTLSVEPDITEYTDSFIVGWDTKLFDGEDKNYYEETVNQDHIHYPCIDLTDIYEELGSDILNYSFIFNNNYVNENDDSGNTIVTNDVRYTEIFSIGSQALLQFGLKDGVIHPLLVLVGAKSMPDDEIQFMINDTVTRGEGAEARTTPGGRPRLGILTYENGSYVIGADPIFVSEDFVDGSEYETVYPRIKFSSLNLRANSSDFYIFYNGRELELAKDYIIQTRNTERDNNYYPEYYITIFPDSIYESGILDGDFEVHYVLSNADNQIYLDALEISKENAYPKVEYTVEPTILNHDISRTLYSMLGVVVMINDVQLKLDEAFGYISKVELDLDNVSNDSVEVKNYKTKFEDLFCTIVAQTEAMKQDSGSFHAAAEGKVTLTSDALTKSLIENNMAMYSYLDSYFDSSDVVREKLESLFTEAGEILGDSSKSLNQMRALSTKNASILNNFAQNIAREMTTKVVQSSTKPTSYKPGDIWIDDQGNRYVATGYSSESPAGGTSGFARTYDGTLASITGAALDINADDGKIRLTAANDLYLASNQVDIVGNDIVNIGGAKVNIVSLTKDGTSYNPGGINLIAGAYQPNGNYGNTSRVLISPTLIEMGAAILRFKAAANIDMIASTGDAANTSTITLNSDTGIWVGSGKSVSLFSGTNTSGANVQLTPTRIIMGVTSGADTSAFEIQKDFLIMASGTTSSNFSSSNVTLNSTGSLTGMKLTKESFGLAIGSSTTRTVILANSNGITLGTGETPITDAATKTGSYVNISGTGIEIGSLGKLYVNMTNFKLQTDASNNTRFAVGSLSNIDLTTLNSTSNFTGMVYNTNGLFINGRIYADEFVAHSSTNEFRANSSAFGFYKANNDPILIIDSTGAMTASEDLTISSGNALTISGASLTFAASGNTSGTINIDSANFKVNSSPSNNENYFYVGDSGNDPTSYMRYVKDTTNGDHLDIKGAITATSFTLAQNATASIPWTSITGAPTFTIDGLSSQWHKTVDTILSTDNETVLYNVPAVSEQNFDNIITFDATQSYSTNTLVKSAETNDDNVYCLYEGHTVGDAWADTVKEVVYKKSIDLTSSNSLVLGANNGFYIIKNPTDPLDKEASVAINSSFINLAYSNSNYIHMSEDGIEVQGSKIMINGEDVWSRGDIIFCAATTENEFEHPTDRDWVWIKPNDTTSTTGSRSFSLKVSTVANGSDYYGITLGEVLSNNEEQVTITCDVFLYTSTSYGSATQVSLSLGLYPSSGDTAVRNFNFSNKKIPRSASNAATKITSTATVVTSAFSSNSIRLKFNSASATGSDLSIPNAAANVYITKVQFTVTKYATSGGKIGCNVYYFDVQ